MTRLPALGPRAFELATIVLLAAALGVWWADRTDTGPPPVTTRSSLLPPETPPMPSALKPTPLTADGFRTLIASTDQPVLVEFWAPWCPPCRAMAPTVDALAAAYEGRAAVAKIDIDEHPQVAEELGVSSIPTFVLFEGGEEVQRFIGAKPYPELAAALDDLLGP